MSTAAGTLGADLRDTIFASLGDRRFHAEIRLTSPGLVCGVDLARSKVAALGCEVLGFLEDGAAAMAGQVILALAGTAKALALAEDCVPGAIAKASGIARAARRARDLAAGKVRVVSGATKKMPEEVKPQIKHAVHCGGGFGCIAGGPFVYLDKNYVRMFGGVRAALAAVAEMKGYTRIVQLRGQIEPLAVEALEAMEMGAECLMVDTGRLADLDLVSALVRRRGSREATTIAFAGDIELADIPAIAGHDVDILDIGRAIIDAPSVDIKFDVTGPAEA